MNILSVSELNSQLQSILGEYFSKICVRGEVANLTKHQGSGHYYFSLKDDKSIIRCTLFKNARNKVDFEIEQGMEVEVIGSLSVYEKRGEYQIICSSITKSGIGAMQFEKIKEKLSKEGYFDKPKKPLPPFPKKIALITSASGAALQDIKFVANKRWSGIHFDIFDTLVQGNDAKYQIATNIALADSMDYDIIIITRGGGSVEDLWAFNEEIVAKAIFVAKKPVISAIGHEIDFVISDFVADLRAPTPSACMEMLLPDKNEWLFRLNDNIDELNNIIDNKFIAYERSLALLENEISYFKFDYNRLKMQLEESSKMLNNLLANLLYIKRVNLENISKLSYKDILANKLNKLNQLKSIMESSFIALLKNKQNKNIPSLMLNNALNQMLRLKDKELSHINEILASINPALLCKKGFAQITQNGVVKNLDELKSNDDITLSNGKDSIEARIK